MSLAHPSPSFTNIAGSHSSSTHASSNNLAARTASNSNLNTLPPSLATPTSSSSSSSSSTHLHFAPRPVSPINGFGGLSPTYPPPNSFLSNGTICSCPNEPGSQPCSCTSTTPLHRPSRSMSNSQSMECFHLSSPASRTSSIGTAGMNPGGVSANGSSSLPPSVSPPPPGRFRPSFSLPVHLMNSSSSSGGSGSSHGSPYLRHAAALNMVTPSSLPTTTALHATPLDGINMVSNGIDSGSTTPALPLPLPYDGVVINIYQQSLNGNPISPPSYASLPSPNPHASASASTSQSRIGSQRCLPFDRSIFSPNAPPDLHDILRRQPSVSPEYVIPKSPSPPVDVVVADSKSVLSTANGVASDEGVPLTASTLRLLKKAIDALRSMFPSQEDVSALEGEGQTTSQMEIPSDMPSAVMTSFTTETNNTTNVVKPGASIVKNNNIKCCAPAGTICVRCGLSASPLPDCSCLTGRLFCYCGRGMHSLCTVPSWTLSSQYLRSGHRPQLTWSECAKSLTQLHTESANIWSHIIGSMWMASHWRTARGWGGLRMQAVASSALFAISAIAHTFGAVSQEWNDRLFTLDRCGISATETAIAISGALVHYDRPVEDKVKRRLLIASSIVLGLMAQKVLLQPDTPRNRRIRIWILLFQGATVFAPAFLHLADPNAHPLVKAKLRKYILLVILTGVVGSALYANFWPESWLHAREVAAAKMKAQAVGRTLEEELQVEHQYACHNEGCCALSGARPSQKKNVETASSTTEGAASSVVSTSTSSSSSSSLSSTLSSSPSPSLRFLRWFVDHFLHSHHLMHCTVIVCVHYAFMWCAKWKFTKLALEHGQTYAAAIKEAKI